MRSSLGGWDLAWTRSSIVVRASDWQCRSRSSPGFNPSILRHGGIWGAADEAVLSTVHKKPKNPPVRCICRIEEMFYDWLWAGAEMILQMVSSDNKYGFRIRDPRSGIRKKPIPDPGSGSRGKKGTGSRIPDPDPQHWLERFFMTDCGRSGDDPADGVQRQLLARRPPPRQYYCTAPASGSENQSFPLIIVIIIINFISEQCPDEAFCFKISLKQCCGTGMFIPDPGSKFFSFRALDPGS